MSPIWLNKPAFLSNHTDFFSPFCKVPAKYLLPLHLITYWNKEFLGAILCCIVLLSRHAAADLSTVHATALLHAVPKLAWMYSFLGRTTDRELSIFPLLKTLTQNCSHNYRLKHQLVLILSNTRWTWEYHPKNSILKCETEYKSLIHRPSRQVDFLLKLHFFLMLHGWSAFFQIVAVSDHSTWCHLPPIAQLWTSLLQLLSYSTADPVSGCSFVFPFLSPSNFFLWAHKTI